MVSYYNIYEGNLHPGDIAKSSDIMMIQHNIQDALKNAINDLTEGQSWILGVGNNADQDAFILTPEAKRAGRYIDQMVLAEGEDIDILSIRETSYRQPIKLARSSIYSIIIKMQNKSEKNVPINFELHDANGNLIPGMKTTLTLPKNTKTPSEFEIIFDLSYYPTAHEIDPFELEQDNQLHIENTDEESFESGPNHEGEERIKNFSAGASVVYLYIEALNRNRQHAFDVNTQQDDGYIWNDTDPTFGIVVNKNSGYGLPIQEQSGSGFANPTNNNVLYFKKVYANAPAYNCTPGQAVINGEKVMLADTHVTVGGANAYGNVISYVYMDARGHLHSKNSDPFTGNEPANPIIVTEPHLHIANIITYANDVKDPVIEQSDETQITRPRSHHERIRRLEKKMSYTQDIAIPPRFKYTLTGESWIDQNPNVDLYSNSFYGLVAQELDALTKDGYTVTTDANGNFIIKVSKAESFSVPITLKSETSGKVDTESKTNTESKIISVAQDSSYIDNLSTDDISRAQTFAEVKNMKNDISEGTLTLQTTNEGAIIATTDEQAKETEFNPWDDSQENRPASADITPTTRSYTIESGKNGANDWASEFPAMTFYTDTGYKLKKLEIPIYKFQNCTGIKFIIWKRQGPNNKTNTVWFEKRIYTSKVFSLENAKEKDGYQYMDDGFLIDFGDDGLELPKGQYVIVCIATVESGTGTVFVDTFKPENSKDFCIRYYGAANASHFLLKERYQEIWYNSVKASAENITYEESGEVTSGTITWKNKEAIKTVKPIANLTIPDGTSATISVDVGGGWIEVKNNESNTVTGSGNGDSFRWKIEFKGNKKDTPTLKYDEEKKYALSFEVSRMEPSTSNYGDYSSLDKNMCLTSKPFNANDILREYLGDMNFAWSDNKFSNYEFIRVWGNSDDKNTLSIDISASDRVEQIKDSNGNIIKDSNGQQMYYPIYSFHYVDLKLTDFPHTSVDYSNYDAFLEDDEHNLRMKLDTENSYNDDDIKIINLNDFEVENNLLITDENENTNSLTLNLASLIPTESNQLIAKAKLFNPLDLSQYAGIKMGLKLSGDIGGYVSGLALYISSQYETDVPSNTHDDSILTALPDGLPDLNTSQEDVIERYANQTVVDVVNNNGSAENVYYKSIWNSETRQWEWQMLHNIKPFNIYEFINREDKTNQLTITEDNQDKELFYEIDIDPSNLGLKNAKEIGLIILNDEDKYSISNIDSITITQFKVIKNDYYSVFQASENVSFKPASGARMYVTCAPTGKLNIVANGTTYNKTFPETSSIKITHQDVLEEGEVLCTYDLTSKSTANFNHIGIQLASDCLLTKNMLEFHLKKIDKNGIKTTIEKIKVPTLNYLYYPTTSESTINISQIFKKIRTSEQFDEIALIATNRFKGYANRLKGDRGNTISIYIRNIVLYKAETIPLMHPIMRMKFYLDDADEISREQIQIRKIGTVIEYQ